MLNFAAIQTRKIWVFVHLLHDVMSRYLSEICTALKLWTTSSWSCLVPGWEWWHLDALSHTLYSMVDDSSYQLKRVPSGKKDKLDFFIFSSDMPQRCLQIIHFNTKTLPKTPKKSTKFVKFSFNIFSFLLYEHVGIFFSLSPTRQDMRNWELPYVSNCTAIQNCITKQTSERCKLLSNLYTLSYKNTWPNTWKHNYLSTDYFGTRQIIFGNNINTIEMHLILSSPWLTDLPVGF